MKCCPTDRWMFNYVTDAENSKTLHTDHSEEGWRGLDAACRAAGFAGVLP